MYNSSDIHTFWSWLVQLPFGQSTLWIQSLRLHMWEHRMTFAAFHRTSPSKFPYWLQDSAFRWQKILACAVALLTRQRSNPHQSLRHGQIGRPRKDIWSDLAEGVDQVQSTKFYVSFWPFSTLNAHWYLQRTWRALHLASTKGIALWCCCTWSCNRMIFREDEGNLGTCRYCSDHY
jgi:hypothetical protein